MINVVGPYFTTKKDDIMKKEDLLYLKSIDNDIAQAHMWASYWMMLATHPEADDRNLRHGDGHRFSTAAKAIDAMKTSVSHLHRAQEFIDLKKKLIWEQEKEKLMANKGEY